MGRIGSKCWYREINQISGYVSEWKSGTVLAWSTGAFHGVGGYSIGIVEDEKTMRCHAALVENICFSTEPHRDK